MGCRWYYNNDYGWYMVDDIDLDNMTTVDEWRLGPEITPPAVPPVKPPVLLPCPFCGSTDLDIDHPYISCLNCDAEGPVGVSALDPNIEMWNKRAKVKKTKQAFKVGDVVRVREDADRSIEFYSELMDPCFGKTGKIDDIGSGDSRILFDDCSWWFLNRDLELVVEKPKPAFKIGDVVRIKNEMKRSLTYSKAVYATVELSGKIESSSDFDYRVRFMDGSRLWLDEKYLCLV